MKAYKKYNNNRIFCQLLRGMIQYIIFVNRKSLNTANVLAQTYSKLPTRYMLER